MLASQFFPKLARSYNYRQKTTLLSSMYGRTKYPASEIPGVINEKALG
jgi:hypothetical protein